MQCNNIIGRYKDAADKANKNDDLERELKKLQDSVDREKDKSQIEFEKYKKAAEDREAKLSQDANRRVKDQQAEVEALRSKVDGLAKSLEGLLSALDAEKRSHEKEMASYVREQNEKYNQLMKKKLELDDELAMKRKKLETLERDIEDLKRRLEEEVKKQKLSADKLVEELVTPHSLRKGPWRSASQISRRSASSCGSSWRRRRPKRTPSSGSSPIRPQSSTACAGRSNS
jgi:chromosome segregation ATPase